MPIKHPQASANWLALKKVKIILSWVSIDKLYYSNLARLRRNGDQALSESLSISALRRSPGLSKVLVQKGTTVHLNLHRHARQPQRP